MENCNSWQRAFHQGRATQISPAMNIPQVNDIWPFAPVSFMPHVVDGNPPKRPSTHTKRSNFSINFLFFFRGLSLL